MSKKILFPIIFGTLFLLPVAFLIYCFLPVINYDTKLSQHVHHSPNESLAPGRVYLTDRNGEVITDKMYPNGYFKHIPIDTNAEFMKALLQIEDKNYYSHWGVNLPAKIRALKDNLSGNRVSGGSTITEQYVKNKYFKYTKRSYVQKFREAVLALYFSIPYAPSPLGNGLSWMEKKEKILTLYSHDAYFGNQLYGVGAALEVYFKKENLDALTQEEIVLLLALLHNPGISSLEEKYFQEYFEQVKQRLSYSFERVYMGKLPRKENTDRFPFVTQKFIHANNHSTTIDAQLQEHARNTLQNTLGELSDKNVTNGSVFAIIPESGEILIYQGSKDFFARDIDGQVDVITAKRQPGSTMKPFLYLLALQSGAEPDDLIIDIESEYNSFKEGSVYISENYTLKEYGLVRLKKALGNSFNNATVRLARELGLSEVYEFYKSYGFNLPFPAEHYGYSLVLGNPSISLEQLVWSYVGLLPTGSFFNIQKGSEIEEKDEELGTKFLLYNILSDPDNRDISFGVNSVLSTSVPQAVKTGTSSDFRDNLVVSYHPDLVVGVWVGNNDNSSMQGVTGITGAGYIWHQVIEKAIELGYIKNRDIPTPEGVYESTYCLDTSCFRRENIFINSQNKKYHSAITEGMYSEGDIYEELSEFEVSKLSELGVELRE